jgi:hypothetical protein
MSKYSPLIAHLQSSKEDVIQLTFEELNGLIGEGLPPSAELYTAWWHHSPPNESHPWARDWQELGWQAHPDLAAKVVNFSRQSQPTNWQKELAALKALGGSATVAQIHDKLVAEHGAFDIDNVRKDLVMLSVNDPKRRAYRAWEVRHGKAQVKYDFVFGAGGQEKDREYELYDPKRHGQWEFVKLADGTLELRQVEDVESNVEDAGKAAYDPASETEGKDYVNRSIALRRGGSAFRKAVLTAYDCRCCISGCTLPDVLEAAHIKPYEGASTNVIANSLLLRSDLHTLFDLLRLAIEPHTLKVKLHPELMAHGEYAAFEGVVVSPPKSVDLSKALSHHWGRTASWSHG